MKILEKIEILDIVRDFLKFKTKKEKLNYLGTPFIVGILYLISCEIFTTNGEFVLYDFINDFINALITVMALFISFSLAYLTILITSNSQNIDELKTYTSKKYKLNNKPVVLFQVILSDITYTIVIEILLLVVSFLQKFLIFVSHIDVIKIYLLIDIILLVHIILLLFRNIKNIYFTFWKAK